MIIVIETDRLVGCCTRACSQMHFVVGQLRKLCPVLVFQRLVHVTALRDLLLSGEWVEYEVEEVRLFWL